MRHPPTPACGCRRQSIAVAWACAAVPGARSCTAQWAGASMGGGPRRCAATRRAAAGAARFRRRRLPQLLDRIELAYPWQHDVQQHVLQIHQHPLAIALALDTERALSGFARLFDDALRDGAYMAVGGA